MKYHYDIPQGGETWHELRAGRIGGSEAAALLVNGKTGGLGAAAVSLCYEKAAEFFTGPAESFQTYAMQRGNELEPQARAAYEAETFTDIMQCGYIESGRLFGYSPDGLILNEGLIEIKCPMGPEFVRFAHTREIDPKHVAQMQWGMWITGRRYCDYVMYHPDFFQEIIVERVHADEVTFQKFERNAKAAADLIREILEKLGAKLDA